MPITENDPHPNFEPAEHLAAPAPPPPPVVEPPQSEMPIPEPAAFGDEPATSGTEETASPVEEIPMPPDQPWIPEESMRSPLVETESSEKLRKTVYIGFAATVAVTLAVAAVYIGGRVFAARPVDPAPVVVAKAAPAPAPAAAVVKPPPIATPTPKAAAAEPKKEFASSTSQAPTASAPAAPNAPVRAAQPSPTTNSAASATDPAPVRNLVAPKPGELYLQLAALGPHSLDHFLTELNGRGIHVVVAPAPDAGLQRVLVGPFANHDSLRQQKQTLDASGIESFVREY